MPRKSALVRLKRVKRLIEESKPHLEKLIKEIEAGEEDEKGD
ncbi:hypothetical protein ES706_03731 [subsurface metagenome]